MNCKTYKHYDPSYDGFCKKHPSMSLSPSPLVEPSMVCYGDEYEPKRNRLAGFSTEELEAELRRRIGVDEEI